MYVWEACWRNVFHILRFRFIRVMPTTGLSLRRLTWAAH